MKRNDIDTPVQRNSAVRTRRSRRGDRSRGRGCSAARQRALGAAVASAPERATRPARKAVQSAASLDRAAWARREDVRGPVELTTVAQNAARVNFTVARGVAIFSGNRGLTAPARLLALLTPDTGHERIQAVHRGRNPHRPDPALEERSCDGQVVLCFSWPHPSHSRQPTSRFAKPTRRPIRVDTSGFRLE